LITIILSLQLGSEILYEGICKSASHMGTLPPFLSCMTGLYLRVHAFILEQAREDRECLQPRKSGKTMGPFAEFPLAALAS
jgi:hypothetical protein